MNRVIPVILKDSWRRSRHELIVMAHLASNSIDYSILSKSIDGIKSQNYLLVLRITAGFSMLADIFI
jgi:hypothetical protein